MKPLNIFNFMLFTIFLMTAGLDPLLAVESSLISGSVYCDHNQNGSFDEQDKGLKNIHVQIFVDQCGGTALQTIHTDKDGEFTFKGFDANTYYIRADIVCVCGGRMPTTNTCQKVELKEGETLKLQPFGYSDYGQ